VLNSRYRIVPAGTEFRVPPGKLDALKLVLESAKPSSDKLMVAGDGSTRYRVQPGDSLGRIASHLGTSVRHIQQLNGLQNPNRIYPGQILLISTGSGGMPIQRLQEGEVVHYTVRHGDTLEMIGRRFGIGIDRILAANLITDPNRIYPGMKLTIKGPSGRAFGQASKRYRIRKGDTLIQIARRFGTSIDEIRFVNGIKNPNRIHPGQEILIP